MKRETIKNLTIEELVQEFLANTLQQYDAALGREISRYTLLYRQMELLEAELKDREGDQRRALLPLCDHENPHVRLTAAIANLALAPEKARQTLRIINDKNEFPDAADAFGMLRALDSGAYVPD